MNTFVWKQVHDNITSKVVPDIYVKVLTPISKSRVLLTGIKSQSFHAWLLDLHNAKELKEPSAIWTSICLELKHRPESAVVLEPVSQRLWFVGGYESYEKKNFSGVLKMSFNPVPLRVLTMEYAISKIRSDDPRLHPEQLPKGLRREFVEQKCGIMEEKKEKNSSTEIQNSVG